VLASVVAIAPLVVAALIAIVACRGGTASRDAATDAPWRCGSLTGIAVAPDCSPAPPSCTLPPDRGATSGTRLRARWWVGSAGDRIFQTIHDSSLAADCAPSTDPSGVIRCFPEPARIRVFADQDCSVALLDSPVRHYVPTSVGVDVLEPGAIHAGVTFQIYYDLMTGTAHCVVSSPAVTAYDANVTRTLAFNELAALYSTPTAASSALDALTLRGADGSSFAAVNPPGSPTGQSATAIDRARGAPCQWSDDRCLPFPAGWMGCRNGACAFEGPTCEACDGTERGIGSLPRVGRARCPSKGLDDVARDSVILVSLPRSCTEQDCSCEPGDTVVDFVPPDRFPSLRLTSALGARLLIAAVTDGQGYCERLTSDASADFNTGARFGHAYDAMLGVTCHPAMTSSGMRCVPDVGNLSMPIRGVFRDPGCTQPLSILSGAPGTPTFGHDFGTGEYYLRGPAGSGPYYSLAGTCIASLPTTWWELGPRAESTFEALADQVD